ncbi:hypothetical protein GCM10010236_57000 [Streptomyces eurythermus]|nr:hypothetical protein GCM10010236_57000 [Streptomyces eurythermus]
MAVADTVLRPGARPDPGALRPFLTARLAPHKCPREFVLLDAQPRTATGTVRRFPPRTAGDQP